MTVSIGSGVSTEADGRVGAIEAATAARAGLGGAPADLAVVFASGSHLAAPEALLEGVYEALLPAGLVGCGAGGVLGPGRELEDRTAVAVWAAAFPGGSAQTFHMTAAPVGDGAAIEGLPSLDGASALLLLPDPASFPTDDLLAVIAESWPGVPVMGGLASAPTPDGNGALFHGREVIEAGAVGVRLEGVDVLPCVSQGAAPLGPELTITAAEGNIVHELAGMPALHKLRAVIDALPARERALATDGLLMGIAVEPSHSEYGTGDFLVRGLVGADPETGALAVGALVETGQIVRLHARDAASADRDFADALALRAQALGGTPPAGALCFTCNGRGQTMFGEPDHDAGALALALQDAPTAGFFAAGEIGPVGGQSFLHGFTATVAIFPE